MGQLPTGQVWKAGPCCALCIQAKPRQPWPECYQALLAYEGNNWVHRLEPHQPTNALIGTTPTHRCIDRNHTHQPTDATFRTTFICVCYQQQVTSWLGDLHVNWMIEMQMSAGHQLLGHYPHALSLIWQWWRKRYWPTVHEHQNQHPHTNTDTPPKHHLVVWLQSMHQWVGVVPIYASVGRCGTNLCISGLVWFQSMHQWVGVVPIYASVGWCGSNLCISGSVWFQSMHQWVGVVPVYASVGPSWYLVPSWYLHPWWGSNPYAKSLLANYVKEIFAFFAHHIPCDVLNKSTQWILLGSSSTSCLSTCLLSTSCFHTCLAC